MIAQGCEATLWSSAQVRRFLENEGYKDLWAFLEPDAPISGHDLLKNIVQGLTSEDWHRLFKHHQEIPKPSVIKVRRLLNQLAKLKVNNSVNNVINKEDSEDLSEAEEDFQNLHLSCPYCHQQPKVLPVIIKPERWKALLAFLYVLVVSWITAFVMVIVHDRVPDMEKYPPLPDIILDNVPHIPWAFEMCEVTGMILWSVWFFVVLFHRHRFVLMRRFFSIFGTIFMLRCITMLITSLSVPGTHLECQPRPYGDVWNKLHNAYIIWTGAGMSLQGVRTCGDYMFSGHTVALTLLNFFITEYTTRRIYFLHTFTWICNVFGVFFILAAHEHYSIDVFVAFYISSRLFMYYHMLANQTKNKRFDNLTTKEISYDAQRAWFWFPLFSFFESGIDGKIPNEFAWPLTIKDIRDILVYIQDGFYNLVKTSKIKKKKKKTT